MTWQSNLTIKTQLLTIKRVIYHILLGVSLNSLKQYDKAIKMFDEAISLDHRYFLAYHHKGFIHHKYRNIFVKLKIRLKCYRLI